MKTALYPGKFDPPTLGHLEIISRAASLCDQLYIAVFDGKKCRFSTEERIQLLSLAIQELTSEACNKLRVISFSGLAVECAAQVHADCLIRGLRTPHDFIIEHQMASANRQMTQIETFFLLSSPQYAQLSATLVKEIASYGKHLEGFVPQSIEPIVFAKLSKFIPSS